MSGAGHPTAAELEAAGLYDPAAPGAADRLDLLGYLLDEGCTVDELVAADASHRLVAAAADARLRRHQRPITADEVAALAGISADEIPQAWRALGFADPPPGAALWWASDAPTFAAFVLAAELFGADRLAQFSRVLGRAASQVAEAAVAMFLTDVQTRLEHDGRPPVELARANVTAQQAADTIAVVFESAFRHHVQATQRRIDATTFTAERDRPVLCVGFADLVGSTELAHQLDPAGTARLAADLEQVATDVVARHEGRLVKTIGDGVLFTTPATTAALAIAGDLVRWADADERLRGLRVGLARGPVVWQDGDVHGPVVNLAARLCTAAEGGRVLTDASFAAAHTGADGGGVDPGDPGPGGADHGDPGPTALAPAGEVDLRGFAGPVATFTIVPPAGA